jgi:hypothetical protein
MRRRWLILSLSVLVSSAWAAEGAAALNWVVRTFTDKEGYLTAIFGGSEARPAGENLSIRDLNVRLFSGDATPHLETVLLAPIATFVRDGKRAFGDKTVRVVRDDFVATATSWTYDDTEKEKQKHVTLSGDVRIDFNAELKDILK